MPRVGAMKLKVFGSRSQVVCLLVVEGLLGFRIHLSSFSWERRNGRDNGNYYSGVYIGPLYGSIPSFLANQRPVYRYKMVNFCNLGVHPCLSKTFAN